MVGYIIEGHQITRMPLRILENSRQDLKHANFAKTFK